VVLVIGAVAGEFCMVPLLGAVGEVVFWQFCAAPFVGVEAVVVLPLFTVDVVVVPFVVVCAFGAVVFGFVAAGLVAVGFVVAVALRQFCVLVFFVPFVVVGVVGLVVVFGVVGGLGGGFVVCATAGTARLTRSPAAETKPRIARELMRPDSPFQRRQSLVLVTHSISEV
jgi:hypothetical protein